MARRSLASALAGHRQCLRLARRDSSARQIVGDLRPGSDRTNSQMGIGPHKNSTSARVGTTLRGDHARPRSVVRLSPLPTLPPCIPSVRATLSKRGIINSPSLRQCNIPPQFPPESPPEQSPPEHFTSSLAALRPGRSANPRDVPHPINSYAFQNGRDALANANTHGHQAVARIGALQLARGGQRKTGARSAERMADRRSRRRWD